jgi:hypothetical protein
MTEILKPYIISSGILVIVFFVIIMQLLLSILQPETAASAAPLISSFGALSPPPTIGSALQDSYYTSALRIYISPVTTLLLCYFPVFISLKIIFARISTRHTSDPCPYSLLDLMLPGIQMIFIVFAGTFIKSLFILASNNLTITEMQSLIGAVNGTTVPVLVVTGLYLTVLLITIISYLKIPIPSTS